MMLNSISVVNIFEEEEEETTMVYLLVLFNASVLRDEKLETTNISSGFNSIFNFLIRISSSSSTFCFYIPFWQRNVATLIKMIQRHFFHKYGRFMRAGPTEGLELLWSIATHL